MRYLIFGAGFIAPINTAALLECGDAEICCIANRTRKKAEAMRDNLGLSCPVYTDWREALEKERPDAAVICVFNDQHREYFSECARRGIHVLCEKPLSNTYEDCLDMIRERDAYGIRATVLQTQRYGAVLETAAAYIRAHTEGTSKDAGGPFAGEEYCSKGDIGALCAVEDMMSVHYFWDGRNPWHLDPVRSGGGIVMNYGVHQLDRVHYMIRTALGGDGNDKAPAAGGKTAEFTGKALIRKPGVDVCSSYVMMGVTEADVPYTISCSGYCGPSVNEMFLHFQNAAIKCVLSDNGMDRRGVYVSTGSSFEKLPLLYEDGDGGAEMYAREMRAADAYLRGDASEAPVPLEWAAEMVRLCEHILPEDRKECKT